MLKEGQALPDLIHEQLQVVPFEAFIFPMSKERIFLSDLVFADQPLSLEQHEELISLTTDTDYLVSEVATDILFEKGESSIISEHLQTLSPLVLSEDVNRRESASKLLQRADDRALPLIDHLLQDEDEHIRYKAIQALGNKNFDEVFNRCIALWGSGDPDPYDNIHRVIIMTIGQFDDQRVYDFLNSIHSPDYEPGVVTIAQSVLQKKEFEKAADPAQLVFQRFCLPSPEFIKNPTIAIALMGDQGYQLLAELEALNSTVENPHITELIRSVRFEWEDEECSPAQAIKPGKIERVDDRSRLLWTQKSLFATEDTVELIKLLNEFGDFFSKLQVHFGKDIIGGFIFGSTAEGYRLPTSDFDFGFIVGGNQIYESQIRDFVAKHFPIGDANVGPQIIYVTKEDQVLDKSDLPYLFQGIFIGDKDAFHKIQLNSLKQLNPETWDRLRRKLDGSYGMLTGKHVITRLQERHNLSHVRMSMVRNARRLIHVPPDYQKTKQILQRRI